MDWKQAINRNREGLVGVIAGLAAMAGMASLPLVERDTKAACTPVRAGRSWVGVKSPDANTPTPGPSPQGGGESGRAVSRPLHRAILRILRPAEAALRRLIVIVAAALLQKAKAVPKVGEAQTVKPLPDFSTLGRGQKFPAFALIDPRKRVGQSGGFAGFERILPRISVPGVSEPFRPQRRDETVDIAALLRRIERLEAALKSLPKQARRLNRLMSRRAKAAPGPGRLGPIRPGLPPGHRKRPRHPVDDILSDCHFFALKCGLKPP